MITKQRNFLTSEEAFALPVGQKLIFDIEVFRNYLLIAFNVYGTNDFILWDAHDDNAVHCDSLRWFIIRHTLIGFNSNNFDMPILTYALTGATTSEIKKVCDKIIMDEVKFYNFYSDFQLKPLPVAHIDLINVCPLKGPLELYGARLHAKSIQGMPVKPENFLTQEEKNAVAWYCLKDLDITSLILDNLQTQMQLRQNMSAHYEVDLMSSSDAQIAEKVMKAELTKILGKIEKPHIAPGYSFKYDVPSWVSFMSEPLQALLADVEASEFVVGPKGHTALPESLDGRTVRIGEGIYRVGVGGLHSSETCQAVKAKEGGYLLDVDVASYYPAIILNNKFAPEHLGEPFLDVLQTIVDRRLEAKKIKHPDADSLKIVVNGTYGKFGDKWSCVYSPKNVIQVTLTGQLALLMLIEFAEAWGIRVISANTDGLIFDLANDEELARIRNIVKQWENHTGFNTEETFYSAVYSRDVNNYIAVKLDSDKAPKTKGAYLLPEGIFRFHKNPDLNIVSKAICDFVCKEIPVRDTVRGSQNIEDFVIARTVKGGAEFTGERIGKTVRWYYSRHSKAEITYIESGNKVPRSEGCRPVQTFPDTFPDDLDIDKYIELAEEGLYLIGAKTRFERQSKIFSQEELNEIV